MALSVFPSLPGLTWPMVKAPVWSTIKQSVASLREVRTQLSQYPIWKFTISMEFLRSRVIGGQTYNELEQLVSFLNALGGSFGNFLYDDEDDDTVLSSAPQTIGIGDGTTVAFQIIRVLYTGGFAEPVYNLNGSAVIYDNGSVVNPANYTISATGLVTFNTAPVAGHTIAWSGKYYFQCRFDEDTYEFSKFVAQMFEQKKLTFTGSLMNKV